jgi:hypothetical protein
MHGMNSPRQAVMREAAAVAGALLIGLTAAPEVFAVDSPTSRKMARQIEVMEQIIDQVLIDSPNFLVRGRDNARGLFIKDFGMLFTFEASLVEKHHDFLKEFSWGRGFRIEEKDDGTVIIIPRDDRGSEEEIDPAEIRDEAKKLRKRRDSRQEKLYLRGKTEFVDVFLDYGDTLTTLEGPHWFAIVAYLSDSDYFAENRISRLVLKAKIKDLRDYAADKLSEEEVVKRIVEEEY